MNALQAFFGLAKWKVEDIKPIVNKEKAIPADIKKVFWSKKIPKCKNWNKPYNPINP